MSEFEFIEKIKRRIKVRNKKVGIGIGDDCALIGGRGNQLITTDIQVENIHFDIKWGMPERFGAKLVRINISDIYAKGGIPEYALLSLGINYKNKKSYIDKYVNGVIDELERNKIQLIGGNISSVKSDIFFDMMMMGSVQIKRLRKRDGAGVGDLIAVSNNLGDAAGGLDILINRRRLISGFDSLVDAFVYPQVEYFGNYKLWDYVTSSIDISDGLIGDLNHILKNSRCGANINSKDLPISDVLREYSQKYKKDIFRFALSGGEDYRLLVTLKQEIPDSLIKEAGFIVIGQIIRDKKLYIKGVKGNYVGFEHF